MRGTREALAASLAVPLASADCLGTAPTTTVLRMPKSPALILLVVLAISGCAIRSGGRRGVLYQTAQASGPVLPPPTEGHEPEFCKLNPGACPDPLPEPEPGEPKTTADPWKSFACIKACNAGGDAMEEFCRMLPGRTKREQKLKSLCWGVCRTGKAACTVFCRAYFGPPQDP